MNWKFWENADTEELSAAAGWAGRGLGGLLGVYLLICTALAWWWEPIARAVLARWAMMPSRGL